MSVNDAITAYVREEALQGREDVELTPTTPLVEDEILDSLGIFALVGFLEDRFGVTIEPEEVTFDNFATIATIEALVSSKQAADTSQP